MLEGRDRLEHVGEVVVYRFATATGLDHSPRSASSIVAPTAAAPDDVMIVPA